MMAEFCKQCAEDMGFDTDFDNLFKGHDLQCMGGTVGFNMLCESCGNAWIIDNEGTCGSRTCLEKHGGGLA